MYRQLILNNMSKKLPQQCFCHYFHNNYEYLGKHYSSNFNTDARFSWILDLVFLSSSAGNYTSKIFSTKTSTDDGQKNVWAAKWPPNKQLFKR